MNSNELANCIAEILSSKKGQDILIVKVSEKTVIADYFVICSGKTSIQVKALCEYVEDGMEQKGIFALRKEGLTEGRWSLLDYGSVVVHVFNDESRLFYHLERLWADGDNVTKIE